MGDVETDNTILREDRMWANSNHIQMHPSVTINNNTYTNSTGEDLALSICSAYREAPDECGLSWRVAAFGTNMTFDGLKTPHEIDLMFEQAKNATEVSIVRKEGDHMSIFGNWRLYAVILVIVFINLAIMFYVRSRMKNQMTHEMNSSVSMAVT